MKNITLLSLLIIGMIITGCSSAVKTGALNNNPVISYISPDSGDSSTLITITGSNFGSERGESKLYYGSQKLSPTTWSNNQITVKLYENTLKENPSGRFRVEVNGTASNESPQAFKSASSANILSVSPTQGTTGTLLTITVASATENLVNFVTFFDLSNPGNSATTNIYKLTSTSFYCYVPTLTNITSNNLGIQLGAYSQNSQTAFFAFTSPSLAGIYPSSGTLGTTVSIFGNGFGNTQSTYNSKISVDGIFVNPESWGETEIRIKIPNITRAGSKKITLTTSQHYKPYDLGNFEIIAPFLYERPQGEKISYDNPITLYGTNLGDKNDFSSVRTTAYIIITDKNNSSIQLAAIPHNDPRVTYWSSSGITFKWPLSNSTFSNKETHIKVQIGNLISNTIIVNAN
ncbi:MAG: IPT/TIG domain-containing protein [Candidatus Riflebacteria bacterium]